MTGGDWRPTATPARLRARARLLDAARDHLRAQGLLEVETPIVSRATVTDVQIESLALAGEPRRYLHTSPEYAMKRLLAAGSGDIFQVCRVFRSGELGRLHNPEFTMIEWYRQGTDLAGLMADTAGLASAVLQQAGRPAPPVEVIPYATAFERALGCDPLSAPGPQLADLAARHGLAPTSLAGATRDDLLDFLVGTVVGPTLGRGTLCCLHHFPASQAALARLDPVDPRTAERFELYAEGIELANGFVELADAGEQRRRFESDREERRRRGLGLPPVDERLLAALAAGLPACAGVALGFDRLAMLALGATRLDEVMAFGWEQA